MIKKKDRLFNIFLKTRNAADWDTFRLHRNKTNALLRNAKRNYLYNYFDIGNKQNLDVMWRKINELLNRASKNPETHELKLNNQVIQGAELAEEFNSFFVNLVSSSHSPEAIKGISRNSASIYMNPTTDSEIDNVYKSLKNSLTCDIDSIQVRPVKYVLDIILPQLTHIYNLALSTGVFPKKMQVAKVITIFKGGEKNSLSNYRPISILPVFSKGLEKIINARIIGFANKYNLISPTQFGFRKGRSTELALVMQKEIILKAFHEKSLIAGIYIDFSKAFDRLNHLTLTKKLELYGIRGTPLALITSYLQHRMQCVCIQGNLSRHKAITSGVPQGSLLGPLFFNFYINDISKINYGAKYITYADDTTIFFLSNSYETLQNNVNIALRDLHKWSVINSLEINTAKTKAIIFTPRQSPVAPTLNLTLGNSRIEIVDSVKSLGVFFQKHLSWDIHINHVVTQVAKVVGILAKFKFHLPTAVKLHIYNALFLSRLNYCCLVWGTTTLTNLNHLFVLQKKALRHIACVEKTAHTKALFIKYNITSVHNLYPLNLARKYKHNTDGLLRTFSELTPLTRSYNSRNDDIWKIPFSRIMITKQMLRHTLPKLLNELHQCEIILETTGNSAIKAFFAAKD